MGQAKPHCMQEIAVERNCLLQGRCFLKTSGWSFQQGKNIVRRSVEGVSDDGMSDGR